ncbi:MAG: SAM-dependent methyltransferase [Acidobacteria bacterium]|nr:SAM-dependent methyltransferase [Acidobacteriota bacterium]MBV9476400.1 SAM-dependent methyltransferase [Acidobacteriota bacterium]
MPAERSMQDVLRNLLQYGELSFRDFMEVALYHPQFGYYATRENPVGRSGDYVTAPVLSPAFSFAIGRLVREFVRRAEGAMCSIVDIGCGDGGLIRAIAAEIDAPHARFFGVDRALGRVHDEHARVTFLNTLDQVPRDGMHVILSNELFDAFPFARLMQRGEHLHELWVGERGGTLDWVEREAPGPYEHYFAERGIELAEGQFADVSLEWEAYYADVAHFVRQGMIVTFDYGFPQQKLFHPRARRFGTAAAYAGQRVSRDLLANAGEQDLTAHINFTDLERAGEREGATTLFFDRLAPFLLGVGIAEHPLFTPVHELSVSNAEQGMALMEAREDARRLVLPDGIGEELRVLVQGKGIAMEGWSFQSPLIP